MEECSNGMVAYKGGRKHCLWVTDKMLALELRMSVKEVMRVGLGSRVMWYSLKYDQREVIKLGRDVDVEKLIKGNEGYAYVYVAGDEGPLVREVQGGVVNNGVLIGGSSSRGREEELAVDATQRQCGCNAITVAGDSNLER